MSRPSCPNRERLDYRTKPEEEIIEMNPNWNTDTGTTIYSLPPEILTHIFSLVVLGQPCLIQDSPEPPYLELAQKDKLTLRTRVSQLYAIHDNILMYNERKTRSIQDMTSY